MMWPLSPPPLGGFMEEQILKRIKERKEQRQKRTKTEKNKDRKEQRQKRTKTEKKTGHRGVCCNPCNWDGRYWMPTMVGDP
jgi:hypothetical protein